MKALIAGGNPPCLRHLPAFIDKIKTVAEFEPSEYGGCGEDTQRYGKWKQLAGIKFIFHGDRASEKSK